MRYAQRSERSTAAAPATWRPHGRAHPESQRLRLAMRFAVLQQHERRALVAQGNDDGAVYGTPRRVRRQTGPRSYRARRCVRYRPDLHARQPGCRYVERSERTITDHRVARTARAASRIHPRAGGRSRHRRRSAADGELISSLRGYGGNGFTGATEERRRTEFL